jgi:hypothetical protein
MRVRVRPASVRASRPHLPWAIPVTRCSARAAEGRRGALVCASRERANRTRDAEHDDCAGRRPYDDRSERAAGAGQSRRSVEVVAEAADSEETLRKIRAFGQVRDLLIEEVGDITGRRARRAARAAGVREPDIRWRVRQQPTWRNQLAWLHIDGRSLELVIETAKAGPEADLEVTLRHQLA